MDTNVPPKKKKRVLKLILLCFFLLLGGSSVFIYINFNSLLSEALLKAFNSNIISDIYELKFENLRVNLIEGSIRVNKVTLKPREKPLKDYPYINSNFKLSAEKLHLIEVDLYALLKEGKLQLKEISLTKPDVQLALHGEKHVLFPYKDSTQVKDSTLKKRAIVGFKLNQFQLIKASFHGSNSTKESVFEFRDLSITLKDLHIDQQTGKDFLSFKQVDLSIGESFADMKNRAIKHAAIKTFTIRIDSLAVQQTKDTLIYQFKDLNSNLIGLDIQTADSIHHISLGSFNLNYALRSIQLRHVVFKPNVSDAAIQKKFKFQKVNASGSVANIEIKGIHFDSLIYFRKIYIDDILLDSVTAMVFKDKLKPMDTKRFPEYFGQDISKIPIPILVKRVKATRITLNNTERKPDSAYAKVSLTKGNASIEHITNLSKAKPLIMKADAFIDNKVHFNIALSFSYEKPQFSFNGAFKKFDLSQLNHLIKAYTPASVSKGKVDEIVFSGNAWHKKANGTMKFLYHDLKVDLELKKQPKWKSSAIAFAANSILPSSNPSSAGSVPRVVNFHADRDMNKGFINIILKAVLNGVKETMMMSKENKKTHHADLKKNKTHVWEGKK